MSAASHNTPHSTPPKRTGKVIQPLTDHQQRPQLQGADAAAELIRKKVNSLYEHEPSAKQEAAEAEHVTHRSKHQQYMYDLSHSGRSLAEIQTAWHTYYADLPNHEKHEVWQEFYANTQHQSAPKPHSNTTSNHTSTPAQHRTKKQTTDTRSIEDVKRQLLGTVNARGKLSRKSHLKSLAFGLSMGFVTILIFLFGFFNERFIAPFITPSRNVSSTPIIIDPTSSAVGPEPLLIIPIINVEVPVVYDEPTIDEKAIQHALEKGVVWYPTTAAPGETGNGVIFGHSSNNLLNSGKYKFIFVLLSKLEPGDTFYIQKDKKRYAYKVFEKRIVPPSEVSVLNQAYPDKAATFTLITCDPPGTSLNRLIIVAEQISPDPTQNVASTTKQATEPAIIPSNSPSLWSRIRGWF